MLGFTLSCTKSTVSIDDGYTCILNNYEAEAERSLQVQGRLGLHGEGQAARGPEQDCLQQQSSTHMTVFLILINNNTSTYHQNHYR